MKRWISYLLWEAMPLLLLLLSFGFISAINWNYEQRLIFPRDVPDKVDAYMGPFLFLLAVGMALMASGILWLTRIFWPVTEQRNRQLIVWLVTVPNCLFVLLLLAMLLSIVWLGPTALVMVEQQSRPAIVNPFLPQ